VSVALTWIDFPSRRWSGLMRGAVSVALTYRYFDPKGQTADPVRARRQTPAQL
jgi:hypothetical protein